MSQIVFVVEDEPSIKRIITIRLESNGISFLFASNLEEAIKLFKQNANIIDYVALDANLSRDFIGLKNPDTTKLAEIIRDSEDFKGKVFVMSTFPDHNRMLIDIIGSDKCTCVQGSREFTIKLDTIKHIVQMILEKRLQGAS